jgi:hypothetical protein
MARRGSVRTHRGRRRRRCGPQIRWRSRDPFARVIGPFLVAATLIVAVRLPDLGRLLDDLFGNSVLPWILGAMMLAWR